VARLRKTELARRSNLASPLERATSAYLVRRGAGRTLIAGYPWFARHHSLVFDRSRARAIASAHPRPSRSRLGTSRSVARSRGERGAPQRRGRRLSNRGSRTER
jgi:hypothetical protein